MKQIMLKVSIFVLLLTSYGCSCITTGFNSFSCYEIVVDERGIKAQIRDKKINTEILLKFIEDDLIKVLDISADSFEGDVYLVGEYETEEQKERAEAIVKSVEWVNSITTYLLPKKDLKDCGMTDNLKIMGKVKVSLIEDKDIWSTNVEIKTVQCNAILLGVVGSQKEIDKSIAHAENVEGVKEVKSFLKAR